MRFGVFCGPAQAGDCVGGDGNEFYTARFQFLKVLDRGVEKGVVGVGVGHGVMIGCAGFEGKECGDGKIRNPKAENWKRAPKD